MIPGISNLDPASSIMPLLFVLGVTALKEAFEDFVNFSNFNIVLWRVGMNDFFVAVLKKINQKRAKNDKEINNGKACVISKQPGAVRLGLTTADGDFAADVDDLSLIHI